MDYSLVTLLKSFGLKSDRIDIPLFVSHIPLTDLNAICNDLHSLQLEDHDIQNDYFKAGVYTFKLDTWPNTVKELYDVIIAIQEHQINNKLEQSNRRVIITKFERAIFQEWRKRITSDIQCTIDDQTCKSYFNNFYYL